MSVDAAGPRADVDDGRARRAAARATPSGAVPEGAVRAATVAAHDARGVEVRADRLAEEVPVALVLDGVSHAVMLASPSDLEDFALGFALTEGLIGEASDLYDIERVDVEAGIELRLDVASSCAWRLRERRRTLAGRTGCGLCGVDSLAQVRRALPRVPRVEVSRDAIVRALDALPALQPLAHATGATHAAALCSPDGTPRLVREDVGRHNALDKLVGAIRHARLDAADGFVLVTSRASVEMVQKAAVAGAGALVAVSAPTAFAVDVAREAGLLLVGFVRGERMVAYAHPGRLTGAPPPA